MLSELSCILSLSSTPSKKQVARSIPERRKTEVKTPGFEAAVDIVESLLAL